jgi:hypothetical protein
MKVDERFTATRKIRSERSKRYINVPLTPPIGLSTPTY